jgi:DNA/RNA endonuclease YhcR with UshA esterase domain
MKKLAVLAVLLGLLAAPVVAQENGTNSSSTNSPGSAAPVRISAGEAKDHIGAPAIVSGKVAEVNVAERLVRLNLDKPFPNQAFTAVVFAAKTNLFPDLAGLKGKEVEISGTIADYRGRPEIVLNATNQLKVLDAGAASKGERK